MLTIADIAEKAELSPRQIRYVIDHELVQGIEPADTKRGRAREFTKFEGFVIALAGKLCDAGINQRRIKQIMEALHGAEQTRKDGSLWKAWRGDTAGFAVWACNDTVDIKTCTIKLMDRFKEKDDGVS
jgi:DNA-binding transcriptional MerR regulator